MNNVDFNLDFDLARRVQSFFEYGTGTQDILYGVYSGGNLHGLFYSMSEACEFVDSKQTTPEKTKIASIIPLLMNYRLPLKIDKNWNKDSHIKNMKELLRLQEFYRPKSKVGLCEAVFIYIMHNPELVSNQPKFRKIVIDKVNDIQKAILDSFGKIHKSEIIFNEFPKFIKNLKKRTDYVNSDEKTHTYCLRQKPRINYAE